MRRTLRTVRVEIRTVGRASDFTNLHATSSFEQYVPVSPSFEFGGRIVIRYSKPSCENPVAWSWSPRKESCRLL